jgi:hypothetical protein
MRNRETDKPKKIREDDLFYDFFKENLEVHQMPVDDMNWENIYSRVKPANNKILWIGIYSSAAAAVIFLFLFFGLSNDRQKNEVKLSINNKSIKTEINCFQDNKNIQLKEQSTLPDNHAVSLVRKAAIDRNCKENDIVKSDSSADGIDCAVDVYANASKEPAVSDNNKDTAINRRGYDNFNLNNAGAEPIAYEPKKHNKWELSAEIGACNLKPESQGYNDVITFASTSLNYTGDIIMGINKTHPEVAEFAPPFSVSFLAKKGLTSILSIETGITYSYLSTTFKDNNRHNYNANLSLHYLGIPLNLVADIWNVSPGLKIYLSAGPMVEKGIKSDFNESNHFKLQSAKYEGSIKGVQLSINASAGLSYNFYKKWNIYLEPQVSYYFDNNQPTSIRTEKRTIIGINSGFKYDF